MSVKPENQFIAGVHRHLPQRLYRMKNNNPYIAGIADVWYSGNAADLWVEYKFVAKIPKTASVKVELSTLQRHWLRSRYEEGRNVAVIVGHNAGGIVLCDLAWESDIPLSILHSQTKTREELAAWITAKVSNDVHQIGSGNLQDSRRQAARIR